MSETLPVAPVVLAHAAPFSLGPLAVRPATREVAGCGFREVLEPRVMQVLVALARAGGEVVGRDDLTLTCWDGRVVSEDAINRVIARLRRLAERCGGAAFAVETVTKVGYRLNPGSGAPPAALVPAPFAASPALTPPPARRAGRRWLAAAGGLALALLGAGGGLVWIAAPDAPPAAVLDDYRRAREATRAGSADETAHAVALLQSVVEAAPDYAPGWSALAMAYLASLEFTPIDAQEGVIRRADAAWRRALDLDPADPEGRVVKALMSEVGDDLAAIEKIQLDALAAAPGERGILISRAAFLRSTGQFQEAVVMARRAVEADPSTPRTRSSLGRTLLAAGRIEEADAVLDEAARLWPRNVSVFFTRYWAFLETGRPRQALALVEDRTLWPAGVPAEDFEIYRRIAIAFAWRDPADIAAALDAVARQVTEGYGYAQNAMLVQAALGDVDAAFRTASAIYLQEGAEIAPTMFSVTQGQYAGGRRRASHILFGPLTSVMRADWRFEPLMQSLGLMDYWRTTGKRPDICAAQEPPPLCAALDAPRPPGAAP